MAAYVEALQADGFLPVQTQGPAVVNPAGKYPDIYGKTGMAVTVDYPPSVGTFRITVWRVP